MRLHCYDNTVSKLRDELIPVLVSQRVDPVPGRNERRDALDQCLVTWLASGDLLAVPVPNRPENIVALWERLAPAALVLSGGNDLASYGGNAPERDMTERILLERAFVEKVPVFAICRGAQLVLDYFNHHLEQIDGHVATRHALQVDGRMREVNSYHAWGCRAVAAPLREIARNADGVVEAFEHGSLPLRAVMWHPERELPFDPQDLAWLLQSIKTEEVIQK